MAETFTDLRYADGVVRVYHPDTPFAGSVDFLPAETHEGWMDLDVEDLEDIVDLYRAMCHGAGIER